jgi:hypothetical protein
MVFQQSRIIGLNIYQLLMWFWPVNEMVRPYVRVTCGYHEYSFSVVQSP